MNKKNNKYEYDSQNIFAKILKGELAADIMHENDNMLCIKDKYPDAPIHNLVLTKGPYIDLRDFLKNATDIEKLDFLAAIEQQLNQFTGGARVQINIEPGGGQVVFHLHAHVMGYEK